MADYVFYCCDCKQTFVGADYEATEKPRCPKCHRQTKPTGITKKEWLKMSREEWMIRLQELTKQEDAREKRNEYTQSVGVEYEEKSEQEEESFLDSWYADVGKKIKKWAQGIFVVEVIASILGGIIFLIANEDSALIIYGLLILILGPIFAWISSWFVYAFGELVDKTAANERNTQNMLKLMIENNIKNEEK